MKNVCGDVADTSAITTTLVVQVQRVVKGMNLQVSNEFRIDNSFFSADMVLVPRLPQHMCVHLIDAVQLAIEREIGAHEIEEMFLSAWSAVRSVGGDATVAWPEEVPQLPPAVPHRSE